ncbi:Ras GTPase-activating-like protein rng2 [Erysiphe neolycopersici]|uniref:Ras GTPase-activating-like protein rng2 n=1 Tax=Erysiphe neolycopersici TaxID=212602 RepID=A0A420I3D1_9PEZI|nr:Ras GTPase-activating-like protein rng2 [Erysiphe neolycopersici]
MNGTMMPHHLHPLRQTHNLDYSTTTRKSSSSSTQSTIFSNATNAFDSCRTSVQSSTCSYGSGYRPDASEARDMPLSECDNWNYSHGALPSRTRNSMTHSTHSLYQKVTPQESNDVKLNYIRAQSEGLSERPKNHYRTNSNLYRSESIALSRTNSICQDSSFSQSHSIQHPQSPIRAPDLHLLQKSSTSQLRTLSKFAKDISSEDFNILSPTQKVAGLHGRRKLQRNSTVKDGSTFSSNKRYYEWDSRNWMDSQRQFLQAYEYLCHIGEAKEWIENVLQRSIPPIVQLEEALRDGVTLAEIVVALNPDKKIRIFRHPKLQYRHSDNIAVFFRFLADVELPDLFRFELTDLYEKKNTPKVIYCIHALSWLLFRKKIVNFPIGNLLGQLEFEHHELEEMQRGLEKAGVSMPSFENMGADFGLDSVSKSEPEQVESEEDLIKRNLDENLHIIIDLQAQARGAINRLRLGEIMHQLWDSEEILSELQSIIRGDFARQIVGYRISMRRFAISLQSVARGFLTRQRQSRWKLFWKNGEESLIVLQNLIRTKLVKNECHRVKLQVGKSNNSTMKLQAEIRGLLFRRSLISQQNKMDTYSSSIKYLQAAARGMISRRVGAKDRQTFFDEAVSINNIQASAKAMLMRRDISQLKDQLQMILPMYINLQSILRGNHSRRQHQLLIEGLKMATPIWVRLQSIFRGNQSRSKYELLIDGLKMVTPICLTLQSTFRGNQSRLHHQLVVDKLKSNTVLWINLQSIMRADNLRLKFIEIKEQLKAHTSSFETLQGFIRANSCRYDLNEKILALESEQESITKIQALIRAMILRMRIGAEHEALFALASQSKNFQSLARGFLKRNQVQQLLYDLSVHTTETKKFQAISRAVLFRKELGMFLAHLEREEDSIIAFQSAALASLFRSKFEEKLRFFKENMEKVIKIQSFVRSRLQGEAYKVLTTGKNPPVNTVKNFVHLLNDSDFDFNEEIEFERLRKIVVQQVRQNEIAEQYIDQLDIKIALLVKNKITLDEVVKHQKNFGGHPSNLLVNTSMVSGNQFDLKALNKTSRKKLESYQQLFFTLQTQPHYLARLFKHIREQGTAEFDCKRVETLMMVLFGYAQKRREEYYLLKLMTRSAKEEVDGATSIKECLRGNFIWTRILTNYTRSPRDRRFLRELLGPFIQSNITGDPTLDLESDPMQIYCSTISNEELRTGQASHRQLDIPREEAIKDAETRELFINHLRDLREISNDFLLSLESLLNKMPYGIRFVCQQIFQALCQRFSSESQQLLLQTVGNWLWKFYLQPALLAPEITGVIERQLTPLQKRNLGEIAKVLNQVSSGRLFGGENVYLQPLNAYVEDAIERISNIFANIISVPDAERTFDIDEFNDLYAKVKPTLYIKMDDIFAIHQLIEADLAHICPNKDDLLRDIIYELGSAKNNENEMIGVSSIEIQMKLNPKLHDIEDPEAEVKALFMETKRCILYIIRVQTGSNLMEILIRPITSEDEVKWHSVIREEFSADNRARGAYCDVNSLFDIKSMSYKDLKRTALENVLKLEQLGRISRKNFYQDILNAIALDIRTKSRRRVQRHRELEGVRQTLANLNEKAEWLESQRKSYDNYIEQAMMTLQKKGKKRFLMPFSKQYNHERELERSGRKPRFGSFKYSAHTLFDKGVLVSWKGYTDRDWDKTNLTISCDEVGIFFIEGSKGSIQIPGASAQIPMDSLLAAQFANHQFLDLFEGNMRLNVNLFLHLLYKKFYRSDA